MKTYSGPNAGCKIKPIIDNAKESLWIVSPWIGKDYAKTLTDLSNKGVDVRLITSKEDHNTESIEILSACKNRNLSFLVLDKGKERGVFIHAKIYLADKKWGITGSANFTYSGLNKNVETLSIAESPEEVQRIENEFMRLWLTYEKNSLSHAELSSNSVYQIRKALPLIEGGFVGFKNAESKNLTYHPYCFFEYIFRGSVRSPPQFFEDKGFVIIDAVTREIIDNNPLLNEINRKPVSDYMLKTEGKYDCIINQPQTDYRETTELALDIIIKKNTRTYYQAYGNRSYERLYVPYKSNISFLKNYLVFVPLWYTEGQMTDGFRHSRTVFGSSGLTWTDMVYCPTCKNKVWPNQIKQCVICGRKICQNCTKETGLIFKKQLCTSCYNNKP